MTSQPFHPTLYALAFVGVLSACLESTVPPLGVEPEQPTAPMGAIQVSTSTSGTDLDPDGYLVALNEAFSMSIATNGNAQFANLVPGNYQVELLDVSLNCTVEANPLPTEVSANNTSTAEFVVQCTGLGA
jgi:hypothetical protein